MWKEGVGGLTRGNPYYLGERLYKGHGVKKLFIFKSYVGGWVMVFMCVKECVIFESSTTIIVEVIVEVIALAIIKNIVIAILLV